MSTNVTVLSSTVLGPVYVVEDSTRVSVINELYVRELPAVDVIGQKRLLATAGFTLNPASAPTNKIYQI